MLVTMQTQYPRSEPEPVTTGDATTGAGCSLPINFDIGARTVCRDGRCGRLAKLVVNPVTEEVTDLIIEKGFLQKHDRVVPISAVVQTAEGELHLDLDVAELERYPEYKEVAFRVPARGWDQARYRPDDVRYKMSPYEGIGGQSVMPSRQQRFRQGVDFDSTTIGHGTRVRCELGGVGLVDHVLVDCEHGHITHLVIKRGVTAMYHIVPVEAIQRVDDDGVLLNITREEVLASPLYHPR